MMRKLAATVGLLLALSACGSADPFGDAEGKQIKGAVGSLFDDLERADYPAAAGRWCAFEVTPPPPTAQELEAGFGAHPRPWTTKLTGARYTPGGTGFVNLTLTDGAGAEHEYNIDITMEGGTTKVCDLSTGSVHIDAFVH